ncbi:hypothetical protein LX64_02311 [Chitinophaga skermanii]|uniref:SnoaL-like domain-containing protein n=1 Tax=Chitinophaga skermanii TaxID=331697 RepID=A0A327QTT2_9BACT|nr:nuclear transport factor 2 family protein [Chitinophaga skermanii]RAJ05157.1 hypothetical protein LX64_02311 [Chitinophaga skermanii]
MTVAQIAARTAELCSRGEFETAQNELFADNAVSYEQHDSPQFSKETKGLAAIREKGKKWDSMVESVHACEATEPVVAGNTFAFKLRMDVTMKEHGRMDMDELCVYETKDGKIVAERFFM